MTFVTLVVGLFSALVAHGDNFYLINNQPAGIHWGSANQWSATEGGAPAAGTHPQATHDYFAIGKDATNRMEVRTPESVAGVATFGGNSLTFRGDNKEIARLVFKTLQAGGNFILDSGGVVNGMGGTVTTLSGNLTIASEGWIMPTGADNRSIHIASKISGAANTTLTVESPTSTVYFSNPNNDFAGTLNIDTNSKFYLYRNSDVGAVPNAKVVRKAGATIYTKGDTQFASFTSTYPSNNGSKTATIANLDATVDAPLKEALAIAGVEVEIGSQFRVGTGGTGNTYYLNKNNMDMVGGWDSADLWSTGSASGPVASGVTPTIGDAVHIGTVLRTAQETANATSYFLATMYLDAGGELGIKSAKPMCIPDLVLNGGQIGNAYGGTTDVLDGNIRVTADSRITSGGTDRGVTTLANISGDKNIHLAGKGTFTFGGNNANFTGIFVSEGGKIITTSDNALGTTGIQLTDTNLTVGQTESLDYIQLTSGTNGITVNGSLQASDLNVLAGSGTLNGTGSIALSNIDVAAGSTLKQSSGELKVNGNVLNITGTFEQEAGGVLSLIAGRQSIVFENTPNLEGALDVQFDDTFDYGDGIYPLILTQSGDVESIGAFVTDNLIDQLAANGLSYSLTGNGLYIGTQGTMDGSVPEPATWVLLVLGVAGIMWRKRK